MNKDESISAIKHKAPAKPSLSALTAAALALPGLAQAQIETDYQYARYEEADLSAGAAAGEVRERYTIDTHLFRIAAPVGDQAVVANLTYERLSGASPWYITPGANGPIVVMSGASIREERKDLQLTWALPLAGADWGVSVGHSKEDDYQATNAGLEFEYRPDNSAHSYSGGVGYSYDQIDPVRGPSSPDVIAKADKDSFNAYGGISWVLNPQTVVQTAVSYGLHDGYLSDPYKLAFIVDTAGTVRDTRPGERHQFSASAKLRHYLPAQQAALHADYRLYYDSWDIEAHTVELAWHQRLGESWRVTPGFRWYSQSQADFYAPFYQRLRDDGHASSDYRLSPYGAISLRLDIRKALAADWELGAGAEWYQADADYAVGSVKLENPALVEYWILSARVGKQF